MLSWDKAHKYYEYDEEAGNLIYKERPKDTFTKEGLYKRYLAWVGRKAGGRCVGGYLHVIVDGRYYLGHKVMWLLKYNEWVKYPDFEIDHIDGDTMNNHLSNL